MSPAFRIAWRYFRGKKSAQAINIISWISIAAIAVSSAAMIILFSVFNGLESLNNKLYEAFYPDIMVKATQGKFFDWSTTQQQALNRIEGIELIAPTAEDMVLLNSGEEQKVVTLKGVDTQWFQVAQIVEPTAALNQAWNDTVTFIPAILGQGVAYAIGIDVNNDFSGIKVYYPNAQIAKSNDILAAQNTIVVKAIEEFISQEEFDQKYTIIPLQAAHYLFDKGDQITHLEIKTNPSIPTEKIKKQIQKVLGDNFQVSLRQEINQSLYMVMKTEKWAVYAILVMVLFIASFNMIGSLLMLVIEKKQDIAILQSMGSPPTMIKHIFFYEGIIIALWGCLLGLILGVLLCLGQQYFGWIELPGDFIIKAYPIELHALDVLVVLGTVAIVGICAAWFPARKAAKKR
jgi:lipoprotein-releasing system permease protein